MVLTTSARDALFTGPDLLQSMIHIVFKIPSVPQRRVRRHRRKVLTCRSYSERPALSSFSQAGGPIN